MLRLGDICHGNEFRYPTGLLKKRLADKRNFSALQTAVKLKSVLGNL